VTLPLLNATVAFEEQLMSDVSRIITHPRQINLSSTFWEFLNVYIQAVDNLDHRGGTPSARSDFEAYLQERVKKIAQQTRFLKRHRMNFGGYLPWQLEQFLSDTRHYSG